MIKLKRVYTFSVFSCLLLTWVLFSNTFSNHAQADRPMYRMQKNLECSVSEGKFNVSIYSSPTQPQLKFSQELYGDDKSPAMDCGWDSAGAYDGKYFYAFDMSTRFFYQFGVVQQNYGDADVVSGTNIVALYDGSDFIIFDRTKKSFFSTPARKMTDKYFISAGENIAVLIDGDQIISYDVLRGEFNTMSISKMNPLVRPVAIAGRFGAIAYDGTYVYAYCENRYGWRMFNVEPNMQLMPFTNLSGDPVSLISRMKQITLNTAVCSI